MLRGKKRFNNSNVFLNSVFFKAMLNSVGEIVGAVELVISVTTVLLANAAQTNILSSSDVQWVCSGRECRPVKVSLK